MTILDPTLLIPLVIFGTIVSLVFQGIRKGMRRGAKIWEYEAKLFANPNDRNLAKIEIKKYKSGLFLGELTIYGAASAFDGRVTVEINNKTAAELDISGKGKRVNFARQTSYSKTQEKPRRYKGSFYFPIFNLIEIQHGDEVSVRTPSLPLVSGHFVRD